MPEITEATIETALKALGTAIEKKGWLKENKPDTIRNREQFDRLLEDQKNAYHELQHALGIEG